MAPRDNGLTAFADPTGLSLQDVSDRVAVVETLTAKQKMEIRSALNSTALWLHRALAEIPGNHEYLRRAFGRLNYGTLGVGRARVRNVQCLLKQGLKVAGVPTSGRSYLAPLNSTWKMLWDCISDPYAKECLARFMRFAGAGGFEPEQVTDDTVQAFRQALIDENMTAGPDTATQSAIRIWNRMADQVSGWPQNRLTPLIRREIYTLRWHELPHDLVADIERYLTILGGADPTDPLAPPRPLKPRSIQKRRYELLQMISALHHQGETIDNLHSLADLCQIDRVKRALQFFIARHRRRHGEDADPATSTMIGGIADGIRAVAKHYVQASADVVTELTRLANRLNRRPAGMCEKVRAQLAQLDSPIVERRFLSHAQIEMHKLASKPSATREDAIRYSKLLAMEILILAPMRMENLAKLDLDHHFSWPPSRRGDIGIIIPRGQVKNTQPLSYKIPGESAAAFYIYLDRFRPLLSRNNSTALFPGRHANAKRTDTLSTQITELLHAELGLEWSPHSFRHLAVRLYLRAYPGDYEGARRLVAHSSGETTYRTYEGMEMRPVIDRYDRLIESIRGPAPIAPRPRRRPRRQSLRRRDSRTGLQFRRADQS